MLIRISLKNTINDTMANTDTHIDDIVIEIENDNVIEKKIWNPDFPPIIVENIFSNDYLTLPIKRRGVVGLKEIGTIHHLFPDVFLCACLAIPGPIYLFACINEPLWLRVIVCLECIITGGVSVVADGFLAKQSTDDSNRQGMLKFDRLTSVFHINMLVAMLIYRSVNNFMSPVQLVISLTLAIGSLFFFHRRLYDTFVEQNWIKARMDARFWHIGGTIASSLALAPKWG